MNKHRRNDIEIDCAILQACKQGGTKTRVTYQANLNNLRVNHYLEMLFNSGMLSKEQNSNGNTIYRTTPIGAKFLESYEKKTNLTETRFKCKKSNQLNPT